MIRQIYPDSFAIPVDLVVVLKKFGSFARTVLA